jgi:hypothetical protein
MTEKKNKGMFPAQGLVEYVLILALVVAVGAMTLKLTGTSISEVFCKVVSGLGFSSQYCDSAYCQSSFDSLDGWQSVRNMGWEVRDGKLCNTSNLGQNYLFNECSMQNLPDDYTVKISGATLAKGNGYGLFFRLQDYDSTPNGYAFQYDPGLGGAFVVRKWVNGYEINPPIVWKKVPNYTWLGTDRDLEVQVKGDTFTAFADGQEVLTFTDPNYKSGGIGLRTWDSTAVCIDGLSIEPLR